MCSFLLRFAGPWWHHLHWRAPKRPAGSRLHSLFLLSRSQWFQHRLSFTSTQTQDRRTKTKTQAYLCLSDSTGIWICTSYLRCQIPSLLIKTADVFDLHLQIPTREEPNICTDAAADHIIRIWRSKGSHLTGGANTPLAPGHVFSLFILLHFVLSRLLQVAHDNIPILLSAV